MDIKDIFTEICSHLSLKEIVELEQLSKDHQKWIREHGWMHLLIKLNDRNYEYVIKNYLGSKIEEAAKITDAAGKITYEAEIEKGKEEIELIFDANGQFIKKMVEAKYEKSKA